MDGESQSKIVDTPTLRSYCSPKTPPPTTISSAAQCPPRPPYRRAGPSSFAKVNVEQIDEVNPSNLPAMRRGKKQTSWV